MQREISGDLGEELATCRDFHFAINIDQCIYAAGCIQHSGRDYQILTVAGLDQHEIVGRLGTLTAFPDPGFTGHLPRDVTVAIEQHRDTLPRTHFCYIDYNIIRVGIVTTSTERQVDTITSFDR